MPPSWGASIGATLAFNPPTAASDCLNAQKQALFNQGQIAQTDTNSCLTECANGVTGAAVQGVNAATQTDVTDITKLDPTKAPAALAKALSSSTSDIGKFLSAAGTLTAVVQDKVLGEQTNLQPNLLPVVTKVSEEVKSPSAATSQLFGIPIVGENGQFTFTGTSVADILKGLASFINSPVGQYLARTLKSQCGLNPDLCKGPSNARSTIGQLVFGSGNPTGVAAARLLYNEVGQAQITSGDPGRNEVSITDQLSSNGLIDAQFRVAIEETLTVQEAIDRKLIDPQKTFGFDNNGQEPRDGYPFRALQYLRTYRVTPVGWELAAKYSEQFDHRALSFGYLIQKYNMCGQDDQHKVCTNGDKVDQACTADSDCRDADNTPHTCGASPYCGLVDPNWVLKAPQTYCRRQGAGEEIISKEFVCDQNNVDAVTGSLIPPGTTCTDPSQRNADGTPIDTSNAICTDIGEPNCVQSATNQYPDHGRWVIERTSDTCADTQSCIAENDDGSCIAFGYCVQERQQYKFNGTQCSAQYATCTTYTDPSGQAVAYLNNTLDSRNCSADNAGCTAYCSAQSYNATTQQCQDPTQTINFTGKVGRCDQSQVGCQQFLRTTNGTNLLANSGFETYSGALGDGSNANPPGWMINTPKVVSVAADDPAITTNNQAAMYLTGVNADTISQVTDTGHDLYERSFTFSLRAKAAASCQATLSIGPDGITPVTVPAAVTTDWQTFSATLFNPPDDNTIGTYNIRSGFQLGACSGGVTIDNTQLEESAGPTQYKDYGAVNAVYLNGQRQQCTPADVGCQQYTPVNGGNAIDGIVKASDRCTADKVGCGTFQLEPITTVPARSGGPVNIVPPKATQCTAADVGCEEYTNLDEVAKGGEGLEYFKSVKQCIKPSQANGSNPVASTYYTWVGDANLGFVLRAYDLVKSNMLPPGENGEAPCTSLSIGNISTPPTCNDTAATVAAAQGSIITQNQCKSALDLAGNPDCGEYYDSALNVHYRLRSHTVSITDDCHPYRNTIDQNDPATKDNIYHLATSENVSCSALAAGCRAYTGNAAGTTRQVFSDNFENSTQVSNNWIGGASSNAATSLGGHSLMVPTGVAMTAKSLNNQFFNGRTYIVTFTAATATTTQSATKPRVTVSLGRRNGNTFSANPGEQFGAVDVKGWNSNITPPGPDWQQYTVGPLTLKNDESIADIGLQVSNEAAFIDNLVVTEVNDHLYLISTSAPSCSAAELGCAAYTDKQGAPNYLKSFTRLCSEQVVGCEAMIDTQNSSTPFSQTVGTDPAVTTPADQTVTVVNNPVNYCPASGKGCQAVGLPVYGSDHVINSYVTNYLINDPDRYATDLCQNNELSCQAFTGTNGTVAYFKDPGVNTCEFRADSSTGGGQWYISGTTHLCPTVIPPYVGRPIGASCSPVCNGGDRAGKACLQNSDCTGGACVGDVSSIGKVLDTATNKVAYGSCDTTHVCTNNTQCIYLAGSCPTDQNSCTEYRDPTDPLNCRAECPIMQSNGSVTYLDATCQPTKCNGGSRSGQNCQTDDNCRDDDGTPHACVDTSGNPVIGQSGCRPYYYLNDSLQSSPCCTH